MVRGRSKTDGYTLLEVCIVVVIIGLMAAAVAPGISSAVAERRTSQASLALVRLFRNARAEAVGYNRAHLVRYTQAGRSGGTQGRFRVYRNTSNRCGIGPEWSAVPILTGPDCFAPGSSCIDELDLRNDYDYGTHSVLAEVFPAPGAMADICFEPSGAMKVRNSVNGPFQESPAALGGGFFVRLSHLKGGALAGPYRYVGVPWGGDAVVFRR